jgi:DNA (cytosine-5)-methyltransferase 1
MSDERHLWPHWHHLIQECRPATVFGEQVASKDGLGWLDLVQADMEGEDYAFGAFDLCSASFGAPHIRQRLWFVADTDDTRSQGWISGRTDSQRQDQHGHVGRGGTTVGVADTECDEQRQGGRSRREGEEGDECRAEPCGCGEVGRVAYAHGEQRDEGLQSVSGEFPERTGSDSQSDDRLDNAVGIGRHEGRHWDHGRDVGEQSDATDADGRMGDPEHDGQFTSSKQGSDDQDASDDEEEQVVSLQSEGAGISRDDRSGDGSEGGHPPEARAYEVNGFWSGADWLMCRDGKWRPVRSGTFPLVDGATSRVGRLRAYGNAITAQVAQGLIESYMDV